MSCSPSGNPSRRKVLSLGAAALFVQKLAAPAVAREAPIQFGLTPVFLTSDLELLGRLQSYLERSTGYAVELVNRRTYQEVTALLTSGQIDGAWICGYPFVSHQAELQLVAVPLWHSKPLYQSYVIVDANRGVTDIMSLRGDIHAFSDPDSNSGFLVTRAALVEHGQRPESFFSKTMFTYGHRNVIRAVASGLAQSGSVDGYVYEVVSQLEPELTKRTAIVTASGWHGFPPIAAPKNAPSTERLARLKRALLDMHLSEDGRAILEMLELDGFASENPSLFDSIAKNAALVAAAG
ncbi:MAG: phosphonate ABC transporter substrate-binding protein [Bradyrhizobiaceae bacterium]|nr:MAG: phosphonate ABC transporter substrate-binding protein [Bradyrhizobiaceae bacterium]